MIPELTEKQITEQILGFLRSRSWYCLRIQSGLLPTSDGKRFVRLGQKGVPDFVCFRGREALFVEMKRPGKQLSRDQKAWFDWAECQGIIAIWADGLGMFMAKYSKVWTR